MTVSADVERRVFARIEGLEDELIKIALDLGDMDASLPAKDGETPRRTGIGDVRHHERRAGDYVYGWHEANGFEPLRQGQPQRPNILGIYRGTGGGRSLLFNSHLDVSYREMLQWRFRNPDPPHLVGAWRDGDRLVGQGIVNCKGPMSCWMVAIKALKDLGIRLPGDVLMSSVVGETGASPVDEFPSPQWDSHELGARYAASHGAIADYALVAEVTAFTIVPVMTGFGYFKITIFGGVSTYTGMLQRPEPSMERSVSAIVKSARFIERFEHYAEGYRESNVRHYGGITMIPNAVIGAMRSGIPPWPLFTPEVCSLYCDFRIPPGLNPLNIQRDLEAILADLGYEGTVEMYKYLQGQEAWRNEGYDTFKGALTDAHTRVLGTPPGDPITWIVSVWRDINPYNEIGVPSISYCFPTGATTEGSAAALGTEFLTSVRIPDMVSTAKIYAALALDLCSQPTSGPK